MNQDPIKGKQTSSRYFRQKNLIKELATRVLEKMEEQKRRGAITQRLLTSGNHHHSGLEVQKCYLKPGAQYP